MELVLLYAAFAGALTWMGHALTRRWKTRAASGNTRPFRIVLAVLLIGMGLWFTNVVAYRLWAAGGPDTAHKDTHLFWAYLALAIAGGSFLTAGVAWPGRVKPILGEGAAEQRVAADGASRRHPA